MKVFTLELLLTRKCNQTCYYCSHWKNAENYKNEVDLDLIKWIIMEYSQYVKNIPFLISLSGGEPALINNLEDVIYTIKSTNKVKFIHLDSNGLVRIKYPDLIKELDRYLEHLVLDIIDDEIIKFYDLDFLYQKNCVNIIVITQNVYKKLLTDFNFFKNKNMINKFFWYKVMTFKNEKNDINFYDLRKLEIRLKNKTYFSHYLLPNDIEQLRKLCFKNPHTPVIDLQTKQMIHCSINYRLSQKFDLTRDNIKKFFNRELIKEMPLYCKQCNFPAKTSSNDIWNRDIKT